MVTIRQRTLTRVNLYSSGTMGILTTTALKEYNMADRHGAPHAASLTHFSGSDEKRASDSLPDNVLVQRAQTDDAWAFEQLVRRYQQKAYTIAVQMGNGDTEEAKDVTQQAFLKAYKNLKRFKGNASFYTWFYRILVNTCLDSRRRSRRWRQLFSFQSPKEQRGSDKKGTDLEDVPDPNPHSNPDAAQASKELDQALQSSIRSLPEKQRCVFKLKIHQGLTVKEISEILGMRPGTVKSHLFRATKSLKNRLSAWQEPKRRSS